MTQEVKQNFKTYILDTNFCSRIISGDTLVVKKLNGLSDVLLVTSVIVVGELFFMMHKSKQKEANLKNLYSFIKDIQVYPIDYESSLLYGEIKVKILEHFGPKELKKREKVKIESLGFTENDLWIAAVAKQNNFTVVSADNDFQRMKNIIDLKVENWLD